MSKYNNIDYFYNENKELLLESDDYRLCKSIPRNVEEYVLKFSKYYREHKTEIAGTVIDKDIMTKQILDKDEWKDTDNTAKRIMEEIGFLTEDDGEYEFTKQFDDFVVAGGNFQNFLTEKLNGIKSMEQMTMYYNSIISALREGYIYGQILDFPDSKTKFKEAITNADDRQKMKERVFSIYGFAGRRRDVNEDYTPNANYRILTTLRTLDFIEQVTSDFDSIRTYKLKDRAFSYLEKLNANLGEISEEKFEKLIDSENEFEKRLKKLAEDYGLDGNIQVTHSVRLPQVQDAFRNRLIKKYGCKCLMCNISNEEMLVASHIKRASDEDIYGKADYNNGLLLCANHDKLFDRYLISFECFSGKIMISKSLTEEERKICILDEKFSLPTDYLTAERMEYLMNHNKKFMDREGERS